MLFRQHGLHQNENLEHFLLDCDALDTTRRNMPALQRPYNENKNLIMANFLLFNVTLLKFSINNMQLAKTSYTVTVIFILLSVRMKNKNKTFI